MGKCLPNLLSHSGLLHLWVWTALRNPGKPGEKSPMHLSINICRKKQL